MSARETDSASNSSCPPQIIHDPSPTNTNGQPTPQPPSSLTKHHKHSSIKDFFAHKLMRTRSFEGANQTPKDEHSNWFEDLKARITKKTHSGSTKQDRKNSASNRNDDTSSEDASNVDVNNSSDTVHDFGSENQSEDHSIGLSESPGDCSSASIRARKLKRACCNGGKDFDTVSINTLYTRRESCYQRSPRIPRVSIKRKLLSPFTSLVPYLLPLNYTLPWRLISIASFVFVVIFTIVIGKKEPDIRALGFLNGFVFGLIVATSCFLVLLISYAILGISNSQSSNESTKTPEDVNKSNGWFSTKKIATTSFGSSVMSAHVKSDRQTELAQVEDFSSFEILDENTRGDQSIKATLDTLEEDDYGGWVIEFIGDYELRNKSEVKLKLLFAKIENNVLSIGKPKSSHDFESTMLPDLVQQRVYNLETARKFSADLLMPRSVRNVQKYVWSKKYPIKLEIELEESEITGSKKDSSSVGVTSLADGYKLIQLTLFAKTCREKEEWFRRFKKILDLHKIARHLQQKRGSIQSDLSGVVDTEGGPSSGLSPSQASIRSESPSLQQSSVHTSKSAHLLCTGDDYSRKGLQDDEGDKNESSDTTSAGVCRTKSCEQLNQPSISITQPSDKSGGKQTDEHETHFVGGILEDSTLTKETAILFSQSIEYSNFIDSQSNLNYTDYVNRVMEASSESSPSCDWFNAVVGRVAFDVFSHNYWSHWVTKKIERKLHRIRLPYFMEVLTLTNIDLGTNAPQFLNVVSHTFDSFGLSIDFDTAYSGGLTMTFETKLNLLKFKSDHNNSSSAPAPSPNNSFSSNATSGQTSVSASSEQLPQTISDQQIQQSVTQQSQQSTESLLSVKTETVSIGSQDSSSTDLSTGGRPLSRDRSEASISEKTKHPPSLSGDSVPSSESSDSEGDSDSGSSSDSSFDEDELDEISDWEEYGAEKKRQNIVRFVDRIASSRYFQQAAETGFIKRKLKNISNCPLVLVVQIQSLNGILTVNIPPPQTDRLWFGFKPNPELTLKALPKMGDREVNLSPVTDWIERKLADEFKKLFVIPNMEDIVLPILKSDHLLNVATTR